MSTPAGKAPKSETACMFFVRGKCTAGESCEYSHDSELIRAAQQARADRRARKAAAVASGEPREIPVKTKPCKYFSTPEGCKNGDSCTFLHDEAPPAPTPAPAPVVAVPPPAPVNEEPKKVCRFFLRNKCDRADCQFLHEKPEQAAQPVVDEAKAEKKKAKKADKKKEEAAPAPTPAPAPVVVAPPQVDATEEKAPRTCRFFRKGRCNKGDECEFSHVLSEKKVAPAAAAPAPAPVVEKKAEKVKAAKAAAPAPVPAPVAPAASEEPKKICRFFLRNKCTRGAECEFLHERAPKENKQPAPAPAPAPAPVEAPVQKEPRVRERRVREDRRENNGDRRERDDGDRRERDYGDRRDNDRRSAPSRRRQVPGSKSNVCKYYLEDRCEKGDDCPFGHFRPSSNVRGRGGASSRAHVFTGDR